MIRRTPLSNRHFGTGYVGRMNYFTGKCIESRKIELWVPAFINLNFTEKTA